MRYILNETCATFHLPHEPDRPSRTILHKRNSQVWRCMLFHDSFRFHVDLDMDDDLNVKLHLTCFTLILHIYLKQVH